MSRQDGAQILSGGWRALTIRGRIVAITAIAAITAAAVGGIGVWQITRVAAQGTAIYNEALLPDQEVGSLREAVGRARMDGLSRAVAKTKDAAASYSKALEADEHNIDVLVESHSRRALSAAERDAMDRFVAAWHDYREARVIGDQLAAEGRAGGPEFEKLRAERMTPDVNNALGALDDMSKASAATARAKLAAAESARRTGLTVSLIIIFVALLIIVVAGLLTIRAMVGPLKRLRTVLASVADGDLTKRVDVRTSDEVGQMAAALNTTLDTMHDVIRRLVATARRLSGHAEQAAMQSTTASAAIDLISNEIDTIHSETEDVATNLAEIRAGGSDSDQQNAAHLQNVINSIGEQVSLLSRTINDNDLAEATRTTAAIMNSTRETADSLAEIAAALTAMISAFKLEESPRPESFAPHASV